MFLCKGSCPFFTKVIFFSKAYIRGGWISSDDYYHYDGYGDYNDNYDDDDDDYDDGGGGGDDGGDLG